MATKRGATGEEGSTAPPTKKLRTSFVLGDVVTVVVGKGDKETRFSVHKELLCSSSTFFRAATSGQWKESVDKSIKLREALPFAFRIYVEWLYEPAGDILDAVHALRPIRTDTIPKKRQDEGYALVKVWILGDFLGDCGFTNRVMKRLMELDMNQGNMFTDTVVKMILKECPSGSVLYRWMVNTSCAVFEPEFIDQCKGFAPTEFWLDMLKAYMATPRFHINRSMLPVPSQLSDYEQYDVNSKKEDGQKEEAKNEGNDQPEDTKEEGGKNDEEAHTGGMNRPISVIVTDGIAWESFTVNEIDIVDSPILNNKIVSSWLFQTHTIDITGHHPHYFNLYRRWLTGHEMSATLANLKDLAESVDPSLHKVNKGQYDAACLHFMVKSWLLGDHLQDSAFKNATVSTIMHLHINDASKIHEDTIITIATKCEESSGLYVWLVDTLVDIYAGETMRDRMSRWPQQLRDRMLERFMERAEKSPKKKKKAPSKAEFSKYEERVSKEG
ncbi:hypothetical protein PRZ48_013522 [Zasmidium cellare]|uniref:BTB domain-containing protein n=1 Tax=Zasmidium cellare TaxID=395010 RepID=A0ABR0E1A3_ZASCE|nr:hypothetical protein PRZ48_013522 [Zasmidium cellare]